MTKKVAWFLLDRWMRVLRVCVFIAVLFLSADLLAGEKIVTLIHTNDLHSHLLGSSPNIDYRPDVIGGDGTKGGWARIASVIQQEKEKRRNAVLVLDAGDFLMGSLFHMMAREEAVELRLMKDMGYDALTLGNHEFDLKPAGLARILHAAATEGGVPAIVFSNAIFSKESDRDDSLEEVFKRGLIKPYVLLEREGIKIGIFGLMGKDAAEKAPFASPVKFRDPVETAKEMVKILREKEKADMVICLSHNGVRKKKYLSTIPHPIGTFTALPSIFTMQSSLRSWGNIPARFFISYPRTEKAGRSLISRPPGSMPIKISLVSRNLRSG